MAKVELNGTVAGVSGKIDGWVYRQRNGRTSVMPFRTPKKRRPSAAQRDGRARFREAQAYASEIMADPLRRIVYQKLGAAMRKPPNALLISNFLTPPTIDQIDLSRYAGRSGDTIAILASDLVAVVAVALRITTAAGDPVETGSAANEHGVWLYQTVTDAPAHTALKIEVTVRNRAHAEEKQVAEKR